MHVPVVKVPAIAILGCAVVCLGWLCDTSPAQQPAVRRPEKSAIVEHAFKGPKSCIICHNQEKIPDILKSSQAYVSLQEFKTWNDQDKHARAFKNFFRDASVTQDPNQPLQPTVRVQQMRQLLKFDVTTDQRCLGCHANWHKDQPSPSKLNIAEGVSCESCHGPSSSWAAPHQEEKWRTIPISKKEKLGMIDVRDPIKRATQCLSCHVGNVEEGKILTHEMYAAGHPPLPSIEIETFAEHMPPHWRYMDEKPDLPQRDEILKLLNFRDGDLHRTKSVLIDSVMTLRASLRLLASNDSQHALDFAQFDCAACHHDLRTPSWREKRSSGRPGRPQPMEWPTILVELAVRQVAHAKGQPKLDASFQQKIDALRDAFDAQPFGDRAAVAKATENLIAWLDKLLVQLDTCTYDRPAAEWLLHELEKMAQQKNRTLDYESARQLAWAYLTIYKDLKGDAKEEAKESELAKQIRKTLGKSIKFDLAWTQGPSVEDETAKDLAALGDYDPDKFRKAFAALPSLLNAAQPPTKPAK